MYIVAVWDCTHHFLKDKQVKNFNIQEILSQSNELDPRWQGEIPEDSLVAIHTLANGYLSKGGAQNNIGFNILGVQILVLPYVA